MSNDEKRSGIRDIRTLRERLGKVKQGATGNVTPSTAPEPSTDTMTSDDETATDVPVQSRSSEAQQPSETPTENQPEFVESNAAPQRNDSAALSGNEAQFAHPLQLGTYNQAAPQVELTPDDIRDLEEYDRKYSGRRKVLASVGSSLLVLGLFFGYISGNTMDARLRHNLSIESAQEIQASLEISFAKIDEIGTALQSEVKRLESVQSKLQTELRNIKKAKDSKKSKAEKAAKKRAFAHKAVIDRGIDFAVVASKLPTELSLNTEQLLKRSQSLSATARKQLGKFLLDTDRYFRLVGVFQKTSKSVARVKEVAQRRFGPVLAVEIGAARGPAVKQLPTNISAGQILRFNRDFIATLDSPKPTKKKPTKDIALLGLDVPDDGPSSLASARKIVAISTEDAVNVSAYVYPVIRQLLMVQFQELEELNKSLQNGGDALKAVIGELASQPTKFVF